MSTTESGQIPSDDSSHMENESKATKLKNLSELKRNEDAARAKSTNKLTNEKLKGDEKNDAKSSIEDEDDPCLKKKKIESAQVVETFRRTPGIDPRFQQQNQTLRCYVMYTDFYRCEKILGEGHKACTWFRDVFTSICPNAWISRWDELREAGRMPWSRGAGKTQGKFPGDRYGV